MDAWIESNMDLAARSVGDPYDASTDLKQFYGKVTVPANTSMILSDTLPDVSYNFEYHSPILIAVDFMRGAPSGAGFQGGVPPQEATAYWRLGSEASKADRSAGYSQENRIYLIERIEVR